MPTLPIVAFALLAAAAEPPVILDVDATDVARRIVHVKVTLAVKPGALTLHYPQWIPGEHGPTGPIDNVVNLTFTAGDKRVAWRRDAVDLFALHMEIPVGATMLEEKFDFVSPTEGGGAFSSSAIASAHVAVLSWNHFAFVPAGKSDELMVHARLKIPTGWQLATALPVDKRSGSVVDFAPASLTTVVDSPVQLGQFTKRVVLDDTTH